MLDANISKLGYDGAFALDKFGKAKITSEAELIKNVVLFVLFSVPGQYPSLPNIGMNIEDMLYTNYDDIDENTLKNNIISQCGALGVYFDNGTINVRKTIYHGQPSLMIHINAVDDSISTQSVGSATKYQIGITYDQLNKMIYNINAI